MHDGRDTSVTGTTLAVAVAGGMQRLRLRPTSRSGKGVPGAFRSTALITHHGRCLQHPAAAHPLNRRSRPVPSAVGGRGKLQVRGQLSPG
ncbi:hypothetical protein OG426_08810 [Streptomyces canus]|uniref:hypothetical protein n=1 Tax=Streptomyces canus TaxID=58343 RepID=UPI00386D59A4|nr:hypothetical protein OG426_08810 [Streptomyces canus]